MSDNPLKKQIGGSHYLDYKIQPKEFCIKNQIPGHKYSIIERILRYDKPTGKGIEDLEKIKHEIDLIVEIEGWTHGGREIDNKPKTVLSWIKRLFRPGR